MGTLKFDVATLSLSLLATLLLVLFSFGRPNEVCVSKDGRFLPYPLAGKAPRNANNLIFCRLFHRKTCCGVEHTRSALLSVRKLALNGEASQECVNLWGYLECSICDPKIGVQSGAPLICAYFCDRIFRACSEAYFGRDTSRLNLGPCSPGELICAKASYLFSNGTELCNAAGFSVRPVDPGNAELSEEYCYRTQGSLYSIHPSWQPSQKKKPQNSEPTGKPKNEVFNEDAPSRVKQNEVFNEDAPSRVKQNEVFNEDAPSRVKKNEVFNDAPSRVRKNFLDRKVVYCGLGLTVLASGLFFLRRRDPHFERITAILRCKENPDGESKKKNKKSRKKKKKK